MFVIFIYVCLLTLNNIIFKDKSRQLLTKLKLNLTNYKDYLVVFKFIKNYRLLSHFNLNLLNNSIIFSFKIIIVIVEIIIEKKFLMSIF